MGSFAIVKGNSTTCANTKLALLSSDPLAKKAGLKQKAQSPALKT